MNIRAFLVSAILLGSLANPGFAATVDPAATQAAVGEVVQAYKLSGSTGIQSLIQNCYRAEAASLHCLYLDTAGYYVNNALISLMAKPPNPYFAGALYGGRLAAAMKKSGVAVGQQTEFLRSVYMSQQPVLKAAAVQMFSKSGSQPAGQ